MTKRCPTRKAWNGGSPDAAREAAHRRALHALEAMRSRHKRYVATDGPHFADLPMRSLDVPGWVYLPIEDVVILEETAEKIARFVKSGGGPK